MKNLSPCLLFFACFRESRVSDEYWQLEKNYNDGLLQRKLITSHHLRRVLSLPLTGEFSYTKENPSLTSRFYATIFFSSLDFLQFFSVMFSFSHCISFLLVCFSFLCVFCFVVTRKVNHLIKENIQLLQFVSKKRHSYC